MKIELLEEKLNLSTPDLSRVHLLGIGGAGQSALAEILLDMGSQVTGSDLKLSAITAALSARGAIIQEGQAAENIQNATLLVTTAAARADNPEITAAQLAGIPTWQNAELVGKLLNAKKLLAVAGTHGKTTTSGLVAYLLERAGLEPTFYVGGNIPDLGAAGRAGKGDYSVVEADEYARRFWQYQPTATLITNIEADHLDFYGTFENVKQAFAHFVQQIRPGGTLLVCADDPVAATAAQWAAKDVNGQSYGLSTSADWQAQAVEPNAKGGFSFKLVKHDKEIGQVELSLAGLHNVRNALGALAMLMEVVPGVNSHLLCEYAGDYQGAVRRFELKGEVNGITVIDDYAHHPTEIKATLAAARSRFGGRRLVALFQPHTFSRTRDLLAEFATSFEDADRVAIMEIFASRETDTLGVSSRDLLIRLQHSGKIAEPLDHPTAISLLTEMLQPGDVLLTLGAGDVGQVGEQVLKGLRRE